MYFIIFLFIFLFNYYVYFNYTLEYIKFISKIISYFCYYSNIRKDIVEYNLNNVFPNFSQEKIDKIRYFNYYYMIINIFIALNIKIFGNSFLLKYYDNKNTFNLESKKFVCQCHIGLFYDFYSFYLLNNKKSILGIFKGNINYKNFREKNIHCYQYNNIDFKVLDKCNTIFTTIDHYNENSFIVVDFLSKKHKFHSDLVKYSMIKNREIYFYYTILKGNKIINNVIKIETMNKNLQEICQEIANNMKEIIYKYPEQYCWNFKNI